ncbi:MAG: dihydrofolate reductase [Ectothiorhodospiraceae bacterium]|nr:dihydrofolate reductase [Ectothiorhodospiraceae bacterium]
MPRAPTISLIAALTRDRVIGRDNELPWRIRDDLRHFKRLTLGKPIIMGRRNHASIGRALPDRQNIVITRDTTFRAPGCQVAHSPEQALALAGSADEVMIIGGAEIYRLFLPTAHRLYLTWVDADVSGDTYFPKFDPTEWRVASRENQAPGEGSPYPLVYETLERAAPANSV